MNVEEALCDAFCGTLRVAKVPDGFAISTGHAAMDGDHLGFFVVGPNDAGAYRIQDDGMYMSVIEAEGGDLSSKTRQAAFDSLLQEYGVEYDKHSGELHTKYVQKKNVGRTAMRFLAFLMRVQDLILMSAERAISTFIEEATKMLEQVAGSRARIVPNYIIDATVQETPADIGIVVDGHAPVALFFGISELRIVEAMLLQSNAEKAQLPLRVAVMLESDSAVSSRMLQRANNHLDAAPIYRGDEHTACERVIKLAMNGRTYAS